MPDALAVLYQDAWLLAVDKPSGLIVHRGWARDRDTALSRARQIAGRWVYPVHRLDRATSGVLLFALDPDTQRKLSQDFATGQVHKRYLALVRGEPEAAGLIDHPVPRGETGERVAARTRFAKLQRSAVERCSLVEVEPLTGRLHQIRRHFKHISHPLVGDARYGKGDINRLYRERYDFHRLALHAHELELCHPEDGRPLHLCAPVPADLQALLQRLGVQVKSALSA